MKTYGSHARGGRVNLLSRKNNYILLAVTFLVLLALSKFGVKNVPPA
jgi:hypothetical protein